MGGEPEGDGDIIEDESGSEEEGRHKVKSHLKEMNHRRMRNNKCMSSGDRTKRRSKEKMYQSNIQVGKRKDLGKVRRSCREVNPGANWKQMMRSSWGPADHILEGLNESKVAKGRQLLS